MAVAKKTNTKRQQHWRDYIKASEVGADTLLAYAATHKLKDKGPYQCKRALTCRGFLSEKTLKAAFVSVSLPADQLRVEVVRELDDVGCS